MALDARRSRHREAMGLVEVLVALGMLALAMLSMVSVCSIALRSRAKSQTSLTADEVAHCQLTRALVQALGDIPAGTRARFWTQDWTSPGPPYASGADRVGTTDYAYSIYARTVTDANGTAMGGPLPGAGITGNRVKKVDILVTWWSTAGSREGYGRLRTHAARLVNETDTNTTP